MTADITLRPMREDDLAAADALFRLAFGTWFQLADPMQFRGDARLFEPRWRSYRDGGLVAEQDGAMVGLSFAARWGSLGVLGPVAVHPKLWRGGVARLLMPATLDTFARWGSRQVGLCTFPQSFTHLRLYQDFGFWPRHLAPVMARPVADAMPVAGVVSLGGSADRAALVASCRELTDALCPGLDLGQEIARTVEDGLGDTLALVEGSRLDGFAICHTGAGSEGGTRGCAVKFALVRSGAGAAERFTSLIAACEAFAKGRGVEQLSLAASTGRHHVYRHLAERGYRAQLLFVQMLRPWGEACDGPDVFALDDWR